MVLPLLLLKERSINKDKPYLASFVQRLGRITSAQKEALKLLDRFKLIDETQLLGFALDYKKVILDIGFGNGESTVYIANSNPEALVVASEVYKSGIGSLLGSIVENSIGNIKIFDKDIRELLLKISTSIFDEIYIICPDPWPKARHHKRRLLNKDFLEILHRTIQPNGTIYISTDWKHYAEFIEEAIHDSSKKFEYNKTPQRGLPITRFQQRAINEGRAIHTYLLEALKK